MQPIDIAWQLLKEVGVEGPADPRRMGEYRDTRTHMQPTDDLPPEAYEQLNQALEQEAALRRLPTDQSETPPPPGPQDTMRQMPPRSGDLSGLPPHMQDYARQLSARRGRPPQGTSEQDPNQVLRSMSPIDLAFGMLLKNIDEEQYQRLLEASRGEGADPSEHGMSQEEEQDNLDEMAARLPQMPNPRMQEIQDRITPQPSEIPVEDPAYHQRMDDAHQEGIAEGVDMQQTRTPPADVRFRSARNDAEIPKNPFPKGPSL